MKLYCVFIFQGKTTFAKHNFPNSKLISQDILGSRERCLKEMSKQLSNGESIVIDNTNPSVESRREYIKRAFDLNVPSIISIHFTIPKQVCLHNNAYREFHHKEKSRVPMVAYNGFYSKFEKPTLDEGFTKTVEIQWNPKFNTETDKMAWEKHYI